MKIEEIDNCDDLDDIKVFAILVTDVPSKYVAQAKKIDGKYYKEDCFGIEISYHADEDKYVISSEYDKQLYYVDFNVNWHWLDYTFTQGLPYELSGIKRALPPQKGQACNFLCLNCSVTVSLFFVSYLTVRISFSSLELIKAKKLFRFIIKSS